MFCPSLGVAKRGYLLQSQISVQKAHNPFDARWDAWLCSKGRKFSAQLVIHRLLCLLTRAGKKRPDGGGGNAGVTFWGGKRTRHGQRFAGLVLMRDGRYIHQPMRTMVNGAAKTRAGLCAALERRMGSLCKKTCAFFGSQDRIGRWGANCRQTTKKKREWATEKKTWRTETRREKFQPLRARLLHGTWRRGTWLFGVWQPRKDCANSIQP